MALILNIDTALENASIGLSENGTIIASQNSVHQKEHASFLQPAVKQLLLDAKKKINDIDAVSVAIGPGSYTGLRVGLASAKGLCYALDKPMITINTLSIIALASIKDIDQQKIDVKSLGFCPMIDARRMEVFTATYDYLLNPLETPTAKILDEASFSEQLDKSQMVFAGTGMAKFRNICTHPNAIFLEPDYGIKQLAELATQAFDLKIFADIAYVEPFYAKSFYLTQQKKIIV